MSKIFHKPGDSHYRTVGYFKAMIDVMSEAEKN